MSNKETGILRWLWRNWILIISVVTVVVAFFLSISISVDHFIPSDNALNILKSLVDVNIALVAFWGLILIFLLNYYRSAEERIESQRHEMELARDRLVLERGIQRAKGVKKQVEDAFTQIENKYKDRIQQLNEKREDLAISKSSTILVAFIVMIFLLSGVLFNLIAIGKIGDKGLYFVNIWIGLVLVLNATILIFFSLWGAREKYEVEIFEKELKKSWAEAQKKSEKRRARWEKKLENIKSKLRKRLKRN